MPPHLTPAAAQDMGLDHRRAYIPMPQEFQHHADVVASLQEMGCEGMTGRVATGGLRNRKTADRFLHDPLEIRG